MNPYREWIFPRLLDWASGKMDNERAHLMPQANGQVLELGAGTGANFAFYGDQLGTLWALEPELPLLARAETVLNQLPAEQAKKIRLLCGDGHHLPFAENSLDTVICCLVLCTVPKPEQMLREIRRVLKPEGKLLVFEHVAAQDDSPRLQRWQNRLNPVWRPLACGCELNRPTRRTIEQAGFVFETIRDERHPDFPRLVSPIILGVAYPGECK